MSDGAPTRPSRDATRLVASLHILRDRIHLASTTLTDPELAAVTRALVDQLDDHIIPRTAELDAPLLVVIGGSTGSGKSTLTNSLVGATVTPASVIRPTTTSPVLACHPDDRSWFDSPRVLPGLKRTDTVTGDHQQVCLVAVPTVPRGLALLDAPDIDSVVTANRELAGQLLAAADLWLFVTTASRYADAVPWALLNQARERDTALAMVLNRVPEGAAEQIVPHLREMLSTRGLGTPELFVLPELTGGQMGSTDGRLPGLLVAPIVDYLSELAANPGERRAVARRTLDGAIVSALHRTEQLARSLEGLATAVGRLQADTQGSFAQALADVDAGVADGTLLRGEVLARWHDYVGTGELLKSLERAVGRLRDRLSAALRGGPRPTEPVEDAIGRGLSDLIVAASIRASERVLAAWNVNPIGVAALGDEGEHHMTASPDLPDRAEAATRAWQRGVLDLVKHQGGSKRAAARWLSYGVNGTGLALMMLVFASTGGLTGAEVAVAGSASALSQKLLEALFGDQAVRKLADDARNDLHQRVAELYEVEAARFLELLAVQAPDPNTPEQLREAVADVESNR